MKSFIKKTLLLLTTCSIGIFFIVLAFQDSSSQSTTKLIARHLESEMTNAQNIQKTPRFFLKRLPEDFQQKGTSELFFKIMLPLILRENERLEQTRYDLMLIAIKVATKEPLLKTEHAFLDSLSKEYDLIETDDSKRILRLIPMVGSISPSLALAQAFENLQKHPTEKINVFGEHEWTIPKGKEEKSVWRLKSYSSLEEAVHGYALELNRSLAYFKWRTFRKQLPLKKPRHFLNVGFFLKTLSIYRPDDETYVNRLQALYARYQLARFDEAHLIPTQRKPSTHKGEN